MDDIHAPIVLGIICGSLGSFFIYMNTTMAKLRKKIVTTLPRKMIETGLFSVATISVSILFIVYGHPNNCQTV